MHVTLECPCHQTVCITFLVEKVSPFISYSSCYMFWNWILSLPSVTALVMAFSFLGTEESLVHSACYIFCHQISPPIHYCHVFYFLSMKNLSSSTQQCMLHLIEDYTSLESPQPPASLNNFIFKVSWVQIWRLLKCVMSASSRAAIKY